MKIQVYKFTSITPLLMANIESVNRDLPTLKLGTKPNKGDIEKIADGMTYRDAEWGCKKWAKAGYYLPTEAFRSSLLSGCKGNKFAGRREGAGTTIKPLIFPAEARCSLLDSDGKPVETHTPQIDSAVNGNNKARIIVVRPRIDTWQTVVPFEIDDEFAPSNYEQFMELLLTFWNRAGRVAGVGAWRPEKNGRFGKYSVEMV